MSLMAQEKFCIAKDGKAATIIVDENDWKGVIRAARDLGDDVRKVTGTAAEVIENNSLTSHLLPLTSIYAGTIGKSKFIDRLIKQKKLDIKPIKGHWEAYLIDVVDGNLIIAGNDKRGIIIGKKGSMLKKVGELARADMEQFLGAKVNLQTWVKVKESWRDSLAQLRNFGYTD